MTRAPEWLRAATAAAVRDVLAGPHGITDGALLRDAALTPHGVLLTFTWRSDPTLYGYLADDSDPTVSPWMGMQLNSAEEWALDLRMHLMEQLDTGGVRWAPRRTQHEPVMLDLDHAPTSRNRYYISDVPTTAVEPGAVVIVIGGGTVPDFDPTVAGQWLHEVGLDVAPARSSLLSDRLLCWLQAYTDEAHPTPVGHAASSRVGERDAVLDTLQVVPGVDDALPLLTRLLWQVVYEATEQGADHLDVSAAPEHVLRELGASPEAGRAVLPLPAPPQVDPRYQ